MFRAPRILTPKALICAGLLSATAFVVLACWALLSSDLFLGDPGATARQPVSSSQTEAVARTIRNQRNRPERSHEPGQSSVVNASQTQPQRLRWTYRVEAPTYMPGDDRSIIVDHTGQRSPVNPSMIRAVQREMRRIGCYAGRVSGYWDRQSKRAAARFLASQNASLPDEQPSLALLHLAKNEYGTTCARPCLATATSSSENSDCAGKQYPSATSKPVVIQTRVIENGKNFRPTVQSQFATPIGRATFNTPVSSKSAVPSLARADSASDGYWQSPGSQSEHRTDGANSEQGLAMPHKKRTTRRLRNRRASWKSDILAGTSTD